MDAKHARDGVAMYTKHYPANTAEALAEEIGFEAIVWLRSAIHIAKSLGANEGHEWELAAVGLARKAAHFGAMVLDEKRALALDKDRGIECRA